MERKWKTIKGYRGLYKISNKGECYSIKTRKTLKPVKSEYGYLCFKLTTKGKTKSKFAHRLVASAFVSNPENKPFVNHIDGDKENNCCLNLEWVTAAENNRHALEHGLNDCNQKQVAYYEDGKLIYLFDSLAQAGRFFGIGRNTIHARINLCKHSAYKTKNKEWKYFTPLH